MTTDLETRGYTPEMARRLEEREDQLDNLVDIAIHLSPLIWPHLGHNPGDVRNIIEDAAEQYRWHCERHPEPEKIPLTRFVAHYVTIIEANMLGRSGTRSAAWKEHATTVEPGVVVRAPTPSGVSRKLLCFEPCCLDNPHAEMRLIVHGHDIGGTQFDRDEGWRSYGPAGVSGGHPTRSAAEIAQLNAA
jgi:hypothetical protein